MRTVGELGSIGAVLGLDPESMDAQWQASFGPLASGDLPTTLRTLANRAGVTPDEVAVGALRRRGVRY